LALIAWKMSLCLGKKGGGEWVVVVGVVPKWVVRGGGARAVRQLQFQVASVCAVFVLRTIKVRENLMLIELNLQTMPQWAAGSSREIG